MMRSSLSSALAIVVAMGLAACGGGGTTSPSTGSSASTPATTTPATSVVLNQSSASVVLGGSQDPSSSVGLNGDYYLNASTGRLFGPKANNAWPAASLQLSSPSGSVTLPTSNNTTGAAVNTNGAVVFGTVGITGAAGPQGPEGATGAQGITGTAGVSGYSSLSSGSTFGASAQCSTGGYRVTSGLDINRNNVLDTAEINAVATYEVCNGAVGATGAQGVTGTAGVSGYSSLSSGSTFGASAQCPTGGYRVTSGLDINRNNALDTAEINAAATYEVCNGAVGNAGRNGNSLLSGGHLPSDTLDGVVGDLYIDTQVNRIYGPKTVAGWGTTSFSVVGANGADGAQGFDGKNGSTLMTCDGARQDGIGAIGDFCIDRSAGNVILYGPKVTSTLTVTASVWPTTGTSLVGPQGARGDQGAPGSQIHAGSGNPNTNLVNGNVGDLYFDTSSGTLWFRAAASWGTTTSLIGPKGDTGQQGATGTLIVSGAVDPTDTDGRVGDFYLNTVTRTLFGPKNASAPFWSTSVMLNGADGANGNTILSGAGAPPPNRGVVGDFYINTSNSTLFGPKTNTTAWPTTGISLVGPVASVGVRVYACQSNGTSGPFLVPSTSIRFIYCDYAGGPATGTVAFVIPPANLYPEGAVLTIDNTNNVTGGAFTVVVTSVSLTGQFSSVSGNNRPTQPLDRVVFLSTKRLELVSGGSTGPNANRWFVGS